MPKKILLVRHAQSEFNAALGGDETKRFTEPMLKLVDCGITEEGVRKSQKLKGSVEAEFLVVSPLKRSLETALLMFPGVVDGSLKHEVHPLAAERLIDICDIGTTKDILSTHYPWANLGPIPSNAPWWFSNRTADSAIPILTGNPDTLYEPDELFELRIRSLKEYLQSLPYSTIGVVTHSHIIFEMTKHVKGGEEFGVWSQNNEVVEVTLED